MSTNDKNKTAASYVRSPMATKASIHPSGRCPYHYHILNLQTFPSDDTRGQDIMTRFMTAGPDEQPAIFNRSDTNKISIEKGCTCAEKARESGSKL